MEFKNIDGKVYKKVGTSWLTASSSEVAAAAGQSLLGGFIALIFLPFCGVNYIYTTFINTSTREMDKSAFGAFMVLLLSLVGAIWMISVLSTWSGRSMFTKVFFVLWTIICFVGCNS